MNATAASATLSNIFHWALPRLLTYVIAAVVTGVLFVAGVGVYALIWPPVKSPPIFLPTELLPKTTPTPPGSGPSPSLKPEDAVAGYLHKGPLTASHLFGAEIVGFNKVKVGTVTEILMDRGGGPSALIVTLDGDWRTRKQIVLPFMVVNWEVGGTKIEKGVVPYTLNDLQKLPVSPHPMRKPSP